MTISLTYFFEATVIIAVSIFIYQLLFISETNFRFRRVFLMMGLMAAAIVPLIDIETSNNIILQLSSAFAEVWLPEIQVGSSQPDTINPTYSFNGRYLSIAYFIGVVAFAGMFIIRLGNILKLFSHHGRRTQDGFVLVESKTHGSFSFFRLISIGISDNLTSVEKKQIIQHEIAHARAMHSIDVIVANIIHVMFWFNPLMILYKKKLEEVHEFEADQKSVDGDSVNQYCTLLARVALTSAGLSIASHFNNSLTVKRIQMMKTIKKNLNGWKVGLALLISMMTFVFLSCEDQLDNESEFPQEAEIRFKEFNKVHFGETFLIEANEASNEKLSNLEDKYGAPTRVEKFSLATPSGARQFMMLEYKVNTADDKLFTVVEHMPEYPGGFDAMTTFLQENMRYPSEARRKGIEGKVFVGFNVEKNGAVSNVEIMKGLDASCDAEAIRVVREFPKWKPATQKGEVVRVRYVLPINFSLQ